MQLNWLILLLLLALALIVPGLILAQADADTLYLREVTVTAFSEHSPQPSLAASVSRLGPETLSYAGEANPLYAINQLAGVRLEERSPGSYRLSIRGSALRSPFGVRNVKIYWQGTPLTEANGTTPLNLLDAALYQATEVVRSPTGSYYGAGTGGVLLIDSQITKPGSPVGEIAYGSHNYQRYRLDYAAADSNRQWRSGLAYTGSAGYRAHSNFKRLNAYWLAEHELNDEQVILTKLLLARLIYEIPGGLTEEQFRSQPRMARPGSEEKNASIDQQYALLSIGQRWKMRHRLQNTTSFFSNLGFLDHPFNTDYKRDFSSGLGLRTHFTYEHTLRGRSLRWQGGGEYQFGIELARNFGNVAGQPDTLNFDDKIRTKTGFIFLQGSASLGPQWELSAGLSLNKLQYTINRLQDARLPAPYQLKKSFALEVAPRLGVLFFPASGWEIWANLSRGFSPPNLEEIRTNEGSLNAALEAESGINYELGLRRQRSSWKWEFTAYLLQLRQTISSYTDTQSSVVRFHNAGAANQLGVETQLHGQLWHSKRWQLQAGLSAAWQHYRFLDYRQEAGDYSGNAVPGVAPLSGSLQLQLAYQQKFQVNILHFYVAGFPLNSANTAYAKSHQQLNIRLASSPFTKFPQLSFFISSQNVLNEQFSLGYDINAFGQRYYQPAPTRQWFGGICLRAK